MTDDLKVRDRTNPNAPSPGGATDAMKLLAVESFNANKEANKLSAKARKSKKDLMDLMAQGRVSSFEADVGGGKTCEAKIGPKETKVVDLDILEKLVDAATFRLIVGATQGKVTDLAGKMVLSECLKTEVGDDDITIKEVK
jgi:hypothetical protein